jgi:hypothetical protein
MFASALYSAVAPLLSSKALRSVCTKSPTAMKSPIEGQNGTGIDFATGSEVVIEPCAGQEHGRHVTQHASRVSVCQCHATYK